MRVHGDQQDPGHQDEKEENPPHPPARHATHHPGESVNKRKAINIHAIEIADVGGTYLRFIDTLTRVVSATTMAVTIRISYTLDAFLLSFFFFLSLPPRVFRKIGDWDDTRGGTAGEDQEGARGRGCGLIFIAVE